MHPLRLSGLHQQVVTMGERFLFDGHRHRGKWELIIGLRGVTGVRFSSRDFLVSPGQALVIPAGIFHVIWDAALVKPAKSPHEAGPPSSSAYYNLYFSGFSPLAEQLSRKGLLSTLGVDRFWLEMEASGSSAVSAEAGSQEQLAHRLFGLLCQLSRGPAPRSGSVRVAAASPDLRARSNGQLSRLIEKEPSRLHRRSDLARYFRMEPTWLSHKWRALTGQTLMACYFRQKLEQARGLLVSGLTVAEAAERCGFASPFHFSRKYKAVMGVSPSTVRQQRA